MRYLHDLGMTDPIFTYLDIRALGVPSAQSRIPDCGGVYAWFRNIKIPPSLSPEQFVARVIQLVSSKGAATVSGRVGPLLRTSIEAVSDLPKPKQESLRKLAVSQLFREQLSEILSASIGLQSPLYVGKARVLRTRFSQHVSMSSDLSMRLSENDIALRDCVFAYAITDADSWQGQEDSDPNALIEDIVTRICRPGFVLRAG